MQSLLFWSMKRWIEMWQTRIKKHKDKFNDEIKSITLNVMYQNRWKIINTFIYVIVNILNCKRKILEKKNPICQKHILIDKLIIWHHSARSINVKVLWYWKNRRKNRFLGSQWGELENPIFSPFIGRVGTWTFLGSRILLVPPHGFVASELTLLLPDLFF